MGGGKECDGVPRLRFASLGMTAAYFPYRIHHGTGSPAKIRSTMVSLVIVSASAS
jgi:hypothetical protein